MQDGYLKSTWDPSSDADVAVLWRYVQMYKVIKPFNGEGEAEPLLAYEFEPDSKSEVLVDLGE